MAFKQRAYNSVFLLRKSIFLMSFPVCDISRQFFVLDLINLISDKEWNYDATPSSFCCVIRTSSPVGENTLLSPQFSSSLDLSCFQHGKSSREIANLKNIGQSRLPAHDSIITDSVWERRAPRKDEARWVAVADKSLNCYLTFASAPPIEDGSTSWAQAWSKPHTRMSDNLMRLNQLFVV